MDTPIVMLTSGGHAGDAQRYEQLRIQRHLMKPAKHSELLLDITHAAGRTATATPAAKDDESSLSALRILLVEDGKANQVLAQRILNKWGHQVEIAGNGEEAIQLWQQQSFDMILMDVQMPVMDGIEATRRIRELELETKAHIPIVAMTAHALQGDRERCLDAGMDDYVAKPFRRHELSAVLHQVFSIDEPSGQQAHGATLELPSPSELIHWQQALETVAGDTEVLQDVATAALQEFPDLMAALEESIVHQDYLAAKRAAHTIKSSARILDACEIVDIAAEVEEASQAEDLNLMKSKAGALRGLIKQVVMEIDAFLGRLAN
jgi:CheY-like chemotaxis protein